MASMFSKCFPSLGGKKKLRAPDSSSGATESAGSLNPKQQLIKAAHAPLLKNQGDDQKLSTKERAPDSSCDDAGGEATESTVSLNPKQQLEAAYARLFKNQGADEAWRKEIFQKVRILVLGRSGVGKTTLIRLMVGKDGPQSVSEGIAGVQNINKEFLFSSEEQQSVPLIIHDSNGMDVKGKERVNEIKDFIDKHQNGGDFTERIHVVWYIISAIDPRCIDDCDVMQMISEYKIPSLLIMTHSDHEKVKVTEAVLDKLLQSAYAVDEERESVRKQMVKVGNDGVSMGKNNELIIDASKHDTEGLKLVAQRTQQLMDKKLRNTWIAAQAVDLEGKLDRSAGIIAGYARRALFTSLPRVIPLADPLKLAIIFWRVIVIMCQIWVVPPELKEALNETLQKEASCRVVRRIGQDTLYVAGVVAALGTTVLTGGLALPAVIRRWKASGNKVPIVVKTFSLQVLGTILYVKSGQEGSSKHRWKPGVSKEEYVRLCEEFAHNADYQKLLLDFAWKQHSTVDTVKVMMKSQIVTLYRHLLLNRPNSLFSLLSKETQTPAPPDPAHFHQLLDHSNYQNGDLIANEEDDGNDEFDEDEDDDEDDDDEMDEVGDDNIF